LEIEVQVPAETAPLEIAAGVSRSGQDLRQAGSPTLPPSLSDRCEEEGDYCTQAS
jgi:hypothetical protein